jgi:hypothetical protein
MFHLQFGAIRKDYGNSFTQRLTTQRAITSILNSGVIRLISRLPRSLKPRKHFTRNIPSMRLPATMLELEISRLLHNASKNLWRKRVNINAR